MDSVDPHYVTTVQLEGTRYKFQMDWNEREGAWYMTLYQENGTRIVSGLRVVPDWPMLRKVADSAAPPGDVSFVDTSGEGRGPGRNDIGERVVATYFTAEELA